MLKLLWEWWIQMWPNLASSGVCFLLAFVWAHRKFLAEMERRELKHFQRHEELVAKINDLQAMQVVPPPSP